MTLVRMPVLALFASVLAGPSLLAQTINTDYDHSINFAKYSTFTLGKVHATDPSVEQRILVALNRDLGTKYLHPADNTGDLVITVVESNQDTQEYSSFYDGLGGGLGWKRGWGAGGFLDNTATVQDIPAGTLVIDMYDTKTKTVVWRGSITQALTGSADKKDQEMDKAVDKVLAKYPPKFEKKK
jgi:Domain of unknown function (DUF4136)